MPISMLPNMVMLIVVVGLSPGPANLLAMSAGMRRNNRRAFVTWLGMATGFFAAALGLAVAIRIVGPLVEDYIYWLRIVGATYILWLAWSIFHHRGEGGKDHNTSFGHGFVVQLTNAKMVVFDLTIYTTFVLPYSQRFVDLLEAIAWLIIAGPVANAVWLMAGMWLRGLFERYRRVLDTIMAIALALCAVLLLLHVT